MKRAQPLVAALARPPPWDMPFCAIYDVVLGGFVLARFLP